MALAEVIGGALGFLLTLLVLSYLLGDNPLFRLSAYLFVGVAAGYAAATAWHAVILPKLLDPLLSGGGVRDVNTLVPLALSAVLLLKISPRTARWGGLPMAYLVGVGAAVAIGGAVGGTLFPQVNASIVNLFPQGGAPAGATSVGPAIATLEPIVGGIMTVIGTLATLAYFHFSVRVNEAGRTVRPPLIAQLAWLGQLFIAVAFGSLYAGSIAAATAVLIGRVEYLWGFALPFLGR